MSYNLRDARADLAAVMGGEDDGHGDRNPTIRALARVDRWLRHAGRRGTELRRAWAEYVNEDDADLDRLASAATDTAGSLGAYDARTQDEITGEARRQYEEDSE